MILNMRSIISHGPDSDDEADNVDDALPKESIRMTTMGPISNRQGRETGMVPLTKVDTEANYDELSTTASRHQDSLM
jgi:hypothetical protein